MCWLKKHFSIINLHPPVTSKSCATPTISLNLLIKDHTQVVLVEAATHITTHN